MKKIILASLLLTLVACTTASPKQFYRPAGAEQQLEISGRFNQISFKHEVMINDQTVVSGELPYDYADTTLSGEYNGKTVKSDCRWKKKIDLTCLVWVDGEKAATLTF
ncbi:hypothetical protein [uncultured Methylophaga sp.]|jgi:hypothetical protein|uniref:hypothetical protein n=1 Tax=uncultured Methylophaga sp. TaxID=285271 RepID=UPI002602FC8C|nr:hypothetical protein [uncultured Methylophaga sp.]